MHRYSGQIEVGPAVAISCVYATQAALLAYVARSTLLPGGVPMQFDPFTPAGLTGLTMFAVGMLGNLYHHWLLRDLRKPGDTEYKVPTGMNVEGVKGAHAPVP